jgi:hypothetical protein
VAAPTLTIDTTGNPRVEVFLDAGDVDPGTTRLRLWRYSEGREWLVRGGVDIVPGVAALDWEAPFGVPSQYRGEMFAADGTQIGFTEVEQTLLNVDTVWVHNPLVPTNAVNLGTFGLLDVDNTLTRPTVGEVVYGEGETVGRRIGAGRRGVTGKQFGFAVETVTDADALQRMLGGYETAQVGVLCIRTPPPARMPRTFFASVSEPNEVDRDARWGGSRTDLLFTATEVKPPFPGLTTPLLTYSDLDAAFSTYSAMDAAFSSYSDRDRAYEYAGVAG